MNECEVYSTCPQECKNTKGSYECFCAEGFLPFGELHGTECAAQGETFYCPLSTSRTERNFCVLLLYRIHRRQHSQRDPLCTGNPPVLLLPDNVRIRRFNLSSEQYSDYVDNAEHIQALDYLWDPEGQGLSKPCLFIPLLNHQVCQAKKP